MTPQNLSLDPIGFLYTSAEGGRKAIERGAGALGILVEATQAYLGGGRGAQEADTARREGFDIVKGYARDNGLVLGGRFFQRIAHDRSQIGAGAEHTVFFDPGTQRVVKLTHEDVIGDGTLGAKGGSAEYFESLYLSDQLLGDVSQTPRFEGVVTLVGATTPQVITSYLFVKGRKARNAEITEDLIKQGFTRVEARKSVNLWEHKDAGVKIYDAVPSNVLRDGRGILHYIDVDLIPVTSLADTLSRIGKKMPMATKLSSASAKLSRGVEKLLKQAELRQASLSQQPKLTLAEAREQGRRTQREEADSDL